jgi:hypothetical protein
MSDLLPQRRPLTSVVVDDISLDSEGRVAVTNPRLTMRLKTVSAAKQFQRSRAANGNCFGCNAVDKCGTIFVNETRICPMTPSQCPGKKE